MKKIKVAVICGGQSNEREISLKTGAQIAKSLPAKKFGVSLIEITKNGRWLPPVSQNKLPGEKKSQVRSLAVASANSSPIRKFDVAFIGLHGKFGEDGKIQAILDTLGIPYTGSGVLASALGMNKLKTNELVSSRGIKVPATLPLYGKPVKKESALVQKIVAEKIGFPCIVKPNESGSSVGVSIAKNARELLKAVDIAFREDKTVLVQKYIKGRELTCGVMGNSGRTEIFPLPPIEIVSEGKFFDYHSKYFSEITQEICPAPVSRKISKEVQRLSAEVHKILGCDGLTRSDFMLSEKSGELYFLEINTIPGLTEASLCPKEAKAIGWSFAEFLEKQIKLAIKNRKSR